MGWGAATGSPFGGIGSGAAGGDAGVVGATWASADEASSPNVRAAPTVTRRRPCLSNIGFPPLLFSPMPMRPRGSWERLILDLLNAQATNEWSCNRELAVRNAQRQCGKAAR